MDRIIARQKYQNEYELNRISAGTEKKSIQLRKNKRKLEHVKNRMKYSGILLDTPSSGDEVLIIPEIPNSVKDYAPSLQDRSLSETSKVAIFKEILNSNPPSNITREVLKLTRVALSNSSNWPVSTFVSMDYIPIFLEFCSPIYETSCIAEACWCLANIAADSEVYCEAIINLGGLSRLSELVLNEEVCEMVLWVIANIAGDTSKHCEEVIKEGFIHKVRYLIDSISTLSVNIVQVFAWFNSCVAKCPSIMSDEETDIVINTAQICIHYFPENSMILGESIWALAHLTKVESGKMLKVIKSGILDSVYHRFINSPDLCIKKAAIRIIGNLLTENEFTQYVLDMGFLNKCKSLFKVNDHSIEWTVLWCLSNIAAGNQSQSYQLVLHESFSLALGYLTSQKSDVRTEAVFVFYNVVRSPTSDSSLKLQLIKHFPAIANAIATEIDPENTAKLIYACKGILYAAFTDSEYSFDNTLMHFQQSGCLESIEKARYSLNLYVSRLAEELIAEYFDYDETDTYLNPSTNNII